MTKREQRLAIAIGVLVYILGMFRPDILTAIETPSLLAFAGIMGAVLVRMGDGRKKTTNGEI